MKKYKFITLKIITSLLFIYLILSKVVLNDFFQSFRIFDIKLIFLVFILFIINYILSGIKGKYLLIHEEGKVSLKYLISLYFTGSFFNNFMPTIIGGDVYKVYKLSQKIGNHDNALSVIVMGRIISLLVLIFISIATLVVMLGLWGAILLFLYLILIMLSFYFFSFLSHKVDFIRKIYNILSFYKGHKIIIVKAVLISLIVQTLYIFIQYYIFKMIGIDIPLVFAFFILPIVRFIGFFVPSINGIGVQDLLYINVLAFIGISGALSLWASIFYHILKFLVSLVGGFLYALDKDD